MHAGYAKYKNCNVIRTSAQKKNNKSLHVLEDINITNGYPSNNVKSGIIPKNCHLQKQNLSMLVQASRGFSSMKGFVLAKSSVPVSKGNYCHVYFV